MQQITENVSWTLEDTEVITIVNCIYDKIKHMCCTWKRIKTSRYKQEVLHTETR